ncbi:MAG: hypothetical protein U0166_00790 [Acidobacteriota bacterium]
MSILVARTRNSTYVLKEAGGCVERYSTCGTYSTMRVAGIMSARPLLEADALALEEWVIRGPVGEALVLMPETAWKPVPGHPMVLQAVKGSRIVTTPVMSVSYGMKRVA